MSRSPLYIRVRACRSARGYAPIPLADDCYKLQYIPGTYYTGYTRQHNIIKRTVYCTGRNSYLKNAQSSLYVLFYAMRLLRTNV